MITVIGAGAFGTSLAIALAQESPVRLVARDRDTALDLAETRRCTRLPGIDLPLDVVVSHILPDDPDQIVLVAIPMAALRPVLQHHAGAISRSHLVACCKGIESDTGLGPTGIIADCLPEAIPAILTGPSFAADIARGLPTALTLACRDSAVGLSLQQALNRHNLRIYRTQDCTGAELGGALKNVIAIGAGVAIGRGLGDSARAALMTRGFSEIQRLAIHLKARSETLMGLSGFGDLVLTCTSEQSRNFRYGLALGKGHDPEMSQTVEGVRTAQAVAGLAEKHQIDMPICQTLAKMMNGQLDVDEAMFALLTRPLKEE